MKEKIFLIGIVALVAIVAITAITIVFVSETNAQAERVPEPVIYGTDYAESDTSNRAGQSSIWPDFQ